MRSVAGPARFRHICAWIGHTIGRSIPGTPAHLPHTEKTMYRAQGFAHATAHHHLHRCHRRLVRDETGQGTVEYVGLILLLAAVMAVVATKGNGSSIGGKVVKEI